MRKISASTINILLVLTFFAELSLASNISSHGLPYNIFPAVLFFSTFFIPYSQGLWLSILFGLGFDILSTLPFGVYTVSFFGGAMVESWISVFLDKEWTSSPIVAGLVGLMGFYGVLIIASIATGSWVSIVFHMKGEMLLQLVSLGVLTILRPFVPKYQAW